ncbi:hypothetical protein JCM8208_003894 [Rhodotorula glutinis]
MDAPSPPPHSPAPKVHSSTATSTFIEPQRTPLAASQSANALSTPTSTQPTVPLSSAASPASDLATRLANWSLHESPDGPASPEAHPSRFILESPTLPRRALADGAHESQVFALGMVLGDERAEASSEGAAEMERGMSESSAAPAEPPVLDELALFAVSSSVTEILMSIQDLNTLLFEIQELRHATSVAPSAAGPQSSPASEVDTALMRLNAKMDDVRKDYASVESQVQPLLASHPHDERSELGLLRQKWADAVDEWDTVQKDADALGDELKEDKWLVVFRSVSSQASDMMRSLDKVLVQSQHFVADVHGHARPSSSSSVPSPGRLSRSPSAPVFLGGVPTSLALDQVKAKHLLASCKDLHQSLRAKVKYYAPATERVLAILKRGITERSTKNGEVLRRFGDMQAQWKGLQERVELVEHEMQQVERLLSSAATPSSRPSEHGSTLTPPREFATPGRRSPLRRSPSAFESLSLGHPPSATPTRGGPLQTSASSPTVATLGTVSSPDNPLRASTTSNTRPTPPRPPKSLKRLVSESQASPPAALTPPRAPFSLSHRRSASAMSSSYSGLGSSLNTPFDPRSSVHGRRPVSPTPDAVLGSRPRWNASVKPLDEREVLASASKPRSGRLSAASARRPSSRASLTSSVARSYGAGAARPVSPAFSDASSSAFRERPETPSRIPRPSSAMRRQSGVFGLDDPDASTLFPRAVSPTPSATPSASRPPLSASSRYSLSRSMGPPPSSSRRLSSTPASGRTSSSRPTSPALSASSSSYYRSTQTPEPSLMAHVQRLAGVRAPPSATSRPPPVPRVPSSYRQDMQTTPRAGALGATGRLSRPASSLAAHRSDRSTSPLPPGGEPGAYRPNPHDPLDTSIASLVNSLPLLLHVERVDPPLSAYATVEVHSARYTFALPEASTRDDKQGKAIMCKLVDRVGPRARKGEKKVLVRVGGGWQDLEGFALGLLASSV